MHIAQEVTDVGSTSATLPNIDPTLGNRLRFRETAEVMFLCLSFSGTAISTGLTFATRYVDTLHFLRTLTTNA